MRRITTFAVVLLVLLLLLNMYSFFNINSRFVSFLNSSLEQQTTLCGSYMEEHLNSFDKDLHKLLFNYKFSDMFTDEDVEKLSMQTLQILYAKYANLITNISIYDRDGNFIGLYIDKDDRFVIDKYTLQREPDLSPRDKVEYKNNHYFYHYPYFNNDALSGNIIVEVDFDQFAEKVFQFYPKGKIIAFQWVLNAEADILSRDFPEGYIVEGISEIADSVDMFAIGLYEHRLIDSLENVTKVHSAYYPLSIFHQSLGIVFTASQSDFNRFFIYGNLRVSILAMLLSIALIVYLLVTMSKRNKTREQLLMSDIIHRQMLEQIPIGILVLDLEDKITLLNSTAQSILMGKREEELIGRNFYKDFILSNKYLLKDVDYSENTDYLCYEIDGDESIIYKVEEHTRLGGDELKLVALVDVSSLEKSRKQEVAANSAKSQFLASMSHEIRTPMNGILGMVSSLMDAKLPPSEDEKVKIIKKSSGLLMTIINDILDFSKIEAGKMLLEEIPFTLRDEVSLVADLYKPLAKQKGINLDVEIMASVPDNLIGDPFRLRQVIANLVSNAIKFTEKGTIVVGAELMEHYKSRMQLLFWVEDTGIGIPEEKISTIFATYSQTSDSHSRKFGGSGLGTSISKQLVELMNGEIWVESPSRIVQTEQCPGARFSFTIEVFSNEKISKSYNYESIKQLNQITALYLTKEPNPDKNSVSKVLNNFGLNVVTKIYQDSTIDTVLHHINVKKDHYQLVIISDKPGYSGFDLTKRMKDEGLMPEFPVIMVCGNDQPGNFRITRTFEVDFYLIEPFQNKELLDIIQDIFVGLEDQKHLRPILHSLPERLAILLVEDNLINQKVAQSIFKSIGYEIDIAGHGVEAVDKTKEKDYDVVFMDLFMPEMDGFDTTIQLRKLGFNQPIIAMSADAEDERKVEAIRAGMDDYLSKPVKTETIKQLLIKLFSSAISA